MNETPYKLCCGCETQVRATAPICPHCHGYRFESIPGEEIDEDDERWLIKAIEQLTKTV